MSRNTFAKAGAIGTVSLGLLAASLGAGCGSSAPSGSGSAAKAPEKASIVQNSLVVGGCGATGTFTITSPQVIDFIAVNTNNFHNAQMQLQAIHDNSTVTQVNQQIQHADSLLQQSIDSAVTSFNLNKTKFDQTTQQDTSQSTQVTNDITETAKTEQENTGFAKTVANTMDVNFQTSKANQFSTSHQDATNRANSSNDTNSTNSATASNHADAFQNANALNTADAKNSANAENEASNAAKNNAFGTNFATTMNSSLVPIAAGAVGAFPLFNNTLLNSMFTNGASMSATAENESNANNASTAKNAAHTDAFTNANNLSTAMNAADLNNRTHADSFTMANTLNMNHVDNTNLAVNSTHLDSLTQFNNESELSSSRTLNQDSTTSAKTTADTEAHQASEALARAENTSDFDSTNITKNNSNVFVFSNLTSLQSHTFTLTTNLTQSQVNAVIQLFTGNQSDVVSDAAAFPIVTPTCM